MTLNSDMLHQAPDLVWGAQIGTYELRPSGELIWSPGLLRLYGLAEAPQTGEAFQNLVHPEDRQRIRDETLEYLASGKAHYSHTFRILRRDGSVRVILDRGAIERDAAGKVLVIRGLNVDVTDEAHLNYVSERRWRESEERYRKLFDAIDQGFCIVEFDLQAAEGRGDYRVIEANPGFFTKTGFPESIMGHWLRTAAPELEESWYEIYGGVARTGEPIRFENHSELLGRWFEVYAFRLESTEPEQVAILFEDVSARKQQQEQTTLLINEINHRSKNMLGVIQAIARNTAAKDATDFIARFGERVRGLAASNDLLVRNGWRPVELEALIRSQLQPFCEGEDRLALSGPPVALSPVATRALGMALHELATNAAKYGALSTPTGRIRLDWSLEPGEEGAEDRFRLSWIEERGPRVSEPLRRGFGWKVMTMMVESTTSGRVTTEFAPEGLRWRLDCPQSGVLA